ncbi:hypothetical protein [Candidatus Pyrohabitans sp.]
MFRDYFILLLASYDPETKFVISFLKENLLDRFLGENINLHIFVLDSIEVYDTYPDSYVFLKERYSDKNSSLYIFENRELLDIVEMADESLENVINIKGVPKDVNIRKLPVNNKLIFLASIVNKIFILRHKEETRGGEYIELALLSQDEELTRRMVFFKRENIEISTMVYEILDDKNIAMRTYKGCEELAESIERIIRYDIIMT